MEDTGFVWSKNKSRNEMQICKESLKHLCDIKIKKVTLKQEYKIKTYNDGLMLTNVGFILLLVDNITIATLIKGSMEVHRWTWC